MNGHVTIRDPWQYASILGSVWAVLVVAIFWAVFLGLQSQEAHRKWIPAQAHLYALNITHSRHSNLLHLEFGYTHQGQQRVQQETLPFEGEPENFGWLQSRLQLPPIKPLLRQQFHPPLPIPIQIDQEHPEVFRLPVSQPPDWKLLKIWTWIVLVCAVLKFLHNNTPWFIDTSRF